jgi:hypothetical protein
VEANSTGGQGSCRAVAPSDDDDCKYIHLGRLPILASKFISKCTCLEEMRISAEIWENISPRERNKRNGRTVKTNVA